MKKFCIYVLCFFCLTAVVAAKGITFVDGLEDVPLMKGLEQNTDNTFSFGNEESRFVETYLTSTKVGFKSVEKFYRESLPQLGWLYQGTYENTIVFYRDGETLLFQKENSKPLKIRVTVKNRS